MLWYAYGLALIYFIIKLYLRFTEKPVELKSSVPKAFTIAELGKYKNERIYIAVKEKVYDVTAGKSFYGTGGPYSKMAGRDATYALAKMETDPDNCSNIINEKEAVVLADWIAKFDAKYPVVGYISKGIE
eukprot:NODE_693_length_5110_cov_0.285572.p5 type:complete len:130 gc:universal NODE_693_length_5110_cov_0.285572:2333-1944(-)